MAKVTTRKFAGDIRMWRITPEGKVPVIPEPNDPFGNQPIEANALIFGYEQPDPENILSKRTGARYNQIISSIQDPGQASIQLTLLEVPSALVPRLVHGIGAGEEEAGGTVTDDELELPEDLSVPFQLPHKKLKATPAPVVKDADGVKTYVEGDDYRIDLVNGLMFIPEDSDIIADEESKLLISYEHEACLVIKVQGGASPSEDFYITGDMEDRESGDRGLLVIPQCRLAVSNDVDWLSDSIIQPELNGPIMVADGHDAPYSFELVTAPSA